MKVVSLSRYAVKGLGPDPLDRVVLDCPGAAFPSDRRFALIKAKNEAKFNPDVSEWIFKQNFLCAFTYGELLNRFVTSFQDATQELTVWTRGDAGQKAEQVLGPVDLSTPTGQKQLADIFETQCGESLTLVSSHNPDHQFGNTDDGFKLRGDARTIHVVNAATVRELSERIGIPLSPEQFRPNIVVDGLEAWNLFDAVDKTLTVVRADGTASSTLQFQGLSRCIRCDGIGADPLDPCKPQLDIPKLLAKHYPEHGPYLGIYVVVTSPGDIQVGDQITFPGEKISAISNFSWGENYYLWGMAASAGISLVLFSIYGKRK